MIDVPILRIRPTKQGGWDLILTCGDHIATTCVPSASVQAGGHIALIALLTAVFHLEDILGVTL